jgi:hypothetical protein
LENLVVSLSVDSWDIMALLAVAEAAIAFLAVDDLRAIFMAVAEAATASIAVDEAATAFMSAKLLNSSNAGPIR